MNLFGDEVKSSDIVYTPDKIAIDIIEWLNPKGICLDPCRGDGAFYKYLPIRKEYCEIREGIDFFDYNKKIDWIIGNPPYSIFEQFLIHSFSLSDNVCYIVPTNKIFQRQKIMNLINDYGGIKAMRIYGSGTVVGFPFGFSVGAFYFKKKFAGGTEVILSPNLITRPMHDLNEKFGINMCNDSNRIMEAASGFEADAAYKNGLKRP